jgi:hypothetical protein
MHSLTLPATIDKQGGLKSPFSKTKNQKKSEKNNEKFEFMKMQEEF